MNHDKARRQGATHYSHPLRAYFRPCAGGVEICQVEYNGDLGEWKRDWRSSPPESAARI